MREEHFHNCPYPGEMLPKERKLLYGAVSSTMPKVTFEIGCGLGASTYYICEAAKEYGNVYTCDPSRQPTDEFLKSYPYCEYFRLTSDLFIDKMIERGCVADFVFFDGPEDPDVALNDLLRLEPYMSPNCVFGMHDWTTTVRKYDGAVSTKAVKIKEYISKSDKWKLLIELDGSKSAESVGIAFYEKLGV